MLSFLKKIQAHYQVIAFSEEEKQAIGAVRAALKKSSFPTVGGAGPKEVHVFDKTGKSWIGIDATHISPNEVTFEWKADEFNNTGTVTGEGTVKHNVKVTISNGEAKVDQLIKEVVESMPPKYRK